MQYDSDELKNEIFFEELWISFDLEKSVKAEELEKHLVPLIKEKNFNFKEFIELFKDKLLVNDYSPCYDFDQKIYDFLRPYILDFPFRISVGALWGLDHGIDEVFYGNCFWDTDQWKEEHEDEELPQDFVDLMYFDDNETANPHEFLQDCEWVVNHDEETREWLKERYKEDGEEYDEEEIDEMTYDNFKRYWKEFAAVFPEAWKEFKSHVWGI